MRWRMAPRKHLISFICTSWIIWKLKRSANLMNNINRVTSSMFQSFLVSFTVLTFFTALYMIIYFWLYLSGLPPTRIDSSNYRQSTNSSISNVTEGESFFSPYHKMPTRLIWIPRLYFAEAASMLRMHLNTMLWILLGYVYTTKRKCQQPWALRNTPSRHTWAALQILKDNITRD